MKILWFTNIPSPYRVEFFNELGRNCDLTVVFERNASAERDRSWTNNKFISFKGIILKGINIGVDKSLSINALKFIQKDKYDHIVISNPLTPTGIIAMKFMQAKKIPYSILSDGGFPKNGHGIKEKIKRYILSGASLYFSTASIHDQYYLLYGAKFKDIVRYPFTSLRTSDVLKVNLQKTEKEKLRNLLGMKEKKIIISVGRFTHGKGFDVLLKACSKLDEDTGVYIIGGQPTQEYIKEILKLKLKNIHFLEFMSKKELSKYYSAADLFVLPTRGDVWGLVINEAMAHGLPIITTNKCIAGLELVENGQNGYIIPVDNEEELIEKMNELMKDDENREKMGRNNLKKIKEYTIEKMAKRHLEIFQERRRNAEE